MKLFYNAKEGLLNVTQIEITVKYNWPFCIWLYLVRLQLKILFAYVLLKLKSNIKANKLTDYEIEYNVT